MEFKPWKKPADSMKAKATQKWLNIINFEDNQISSLGNVRSLIDGKWRTADYMIGPDGYVYVGLEHKAGFSMLLNVSILVLSAFKPLKGQEPSIYNSKISQEEIDELCEADDEPQRETFVVDENGHEWVKLFLGDDDKVGTMVRTDIMAAQAFKVPNPHNYTNVRKKDGNPANKHVNNLEWCP